MSEPYARKGGGTAHGRTPYRQVSQDDTDGSGVRRARLATWSKLPESLNFTTEENEVWRTKHAQLQYTNRNRWWTSHNAVVFKRWVLTFIIGVLAGLVGTFITFFTRKLTDYKFEKVRRVMDAEDEGTYRGSSFFCYLGFNLLYVSVAILCVYIEPVSAGSGIPEVKCYLNGINVPRIVRVRTLFCKAFGVLFSVAAALPVGKEGPMIHSGSVIGASLAQGTRGLFGTLGDTRVLEFRSDPEKRDFVACGAAAGVATAFGAPIGGVLFALEEGASFWSTQLTWRAFFCGMITIYTLYVVRTSEDLWGSADSTKMFSFGEFTYKTSDGKANFSVRSPRLEVLM
jgi:H+/Cl- antiporter ClcA